MEQRKQARLRSVDNVLLYGDSLSDEIGENRRSHRIDEMRLRLTNQDTRIFLRAF